MFMEAIGMSLHDHPNSPAIMVGLGLLFEFKGFCLVEGIRGFPTLLEDSDFRAWGSSDPVEIQLRHPQLWILFIHFLFVCLLFSSKLKVGKISKKSELCKCHQLEYTWRVMTSKHVQTKESLMGHFGWRDQHPTYLINKTSARSDWTVIYSSRTLYCPPPFYPTISPNLPSIGLSHAVPLLPLP